MVRGGGGVALGLLAINADADSGGTAPVSKDAAGAALEELNGGAIRWIGDATDETGSAGSSSTALALWLFAAAAAIAVIEALIAAGAARRGVRSSASASPPASGTGSSRNNYDNPGSVQKGAAA